MNYWLMKSEPSVYAITDLERDTRTGWEGVRNYQARNIMRDDMQVGDLALFYHSNAAPSGVAGVMRVVRMAYADPSAQNTNSEYFDPRSSPLNPIWMQVDVEYVCTLPLYVTLPVIKADPLLEGIMVAKRGARLSVQPLTMSQFQRICNLGCLDTPLPPGAT